MKERPRSIGCEGANSINHSDFSQDRSHISGFSVAFGNIFNPGIGPMAIGATPLL
jgi:hypothetical protein